MTLRLEDDHDERSGAGFSKHWRQFWLLTNLLQFLPDYAAVSAEFIRQFVAKPAAPGAQSETPVPSTADPAWAEALKFADPECATLLAVCQETGLQAPVVGFELFDPSGAIVAQAELAWPDRRIAVFLPDQDESLMLFAEAGWQVFQLQQTDAVCAALTR